MCQIERASLHYPHVPGSPYTRIIALRSRSLDPFNHCTGSDKQRQTITTRQRSRTAHAQSSNFFALLSFVQIVRTATDHGSTYLDSLPVKMRPLRCPETSVNNRHTTPRNISEESRSQITSRSSKHRGGSLK